MIPGWIKLHRQITEWEWYSDTNACRVFLHLILTANWKAGRFKGVDVPVGSRITSHANLGSPIGLSVQQTRTALDKLQSTGEITVKSTGFGLLVTVTKYASYNAGYSANQQGNQQGEQQFDNSLITVEQQQSNNNIRRKEGKNGEEGKKQRLFDSFWQAYPKKVSKPSAEKAWRAKKADTLIDKILPALERFKQSESWRKESGQFIPNPATWINNERWNDERAATSTPASIQAIDTENIVQFSPQRDIAPF